MTNLPATALRGTLFDLDDTLFDHHHASVTGLRAAREEHVPLQALDAEQLERAHAVILEELHLEVLHGRLSIDEARIARFRRLFEAAGCTADDSVAIAAAREYREAYRAAWRAVPGALDLLAHVRRLARVAVVSNNVRSEQVEKLRACGLDDHVDLLVVSSDEGLMKPEPAIFLRAVARLGVPPRSAVMVGDSWSSDVVGARRAGLRAVWFNRHGHTRPGDEQADELRALEPAGEVAARLLAVLT